MSKKLIFGALVLAFCLMSSVNAATIVWVSDNKGSDSTDQGWIDMLEGLGYTVNLDFRNQEGRTLDAAKIDALNAADLIIISRDTDSGSYDDGSEPTQWNSITTPIIMTIAHIARNNRWLWLNTGATNDTHPDFEVVEPDHPVFAGLSFGAGDQLDILTAQSSFANTTSAGNGALIARRADNDQVWIAEWQAGQQYYSGSAQTAAGPRMYFVAGGTEGNNVDGRYNLTAEGEQMFINAVNYMLGGLKRTKAYGPDPADDSLREGIWVNLSWKPGGYAASHDVYLGDNFDDVNEGTGGTFQRNQTKTSLLIGIQGYPYPDGLVSGTTYYWRVDEVNDLDPNSPWKGDVWSFTVPSRKAYDPVPADDARFIDPDVTLSWTPGLGAGLHHVYFGDNADDVAAGTPDTDKGDVPTASFVPGTLEQDKSYYWRIDEFDGTETHTGDLWSFKTMPEIAVSDPNLVAWWKLDEGQGTTALDWSGNGNHGVLRGDPQWAEGYDGDALDLDGDGDHLYIASVQLPTSAFTVAFWFSPAVDLRAGSGRRDFMYWQSVSRPHVTFDRSGNGEVGMWPNVDGDFDGPETVTSSWAAGIWYHIAGTFDGTNFRIYVNGNMERSVNHPGTHAATTGLFIGCTSSVVNFFDGKMDEVRIYNKALTQEEIELAMRGDPLLAWGPKPTNGSTPGIKDALPLSWSAGDKASQHYVYFGTDKNAVTDADTSDTTGIYRGLQSATSYTPPEGVEWGGGPYYWRIDEHNNDATVSKGRVWRFSVADFVPVDDFELYKGDEVPVTEQIWGKWRDGVGYGAVGMPPYYAGNGTGSEVGDVTTTSYTEESITHNGSAQSMPYWYNNNKQGYFKYSESQMTLTAPRDWSDEGVKALSLWFRGYPASVGSFTEGPVGTYTITASGTDIWDVTGLGAGYHDEFHFAYRQLSGAGSIVARVESVENTNGWAKAGVMIRDTLDANSVHAMMVVTPASGVSFQRRTAVGDASASTTEGGITAPQWVKIERDAGGNMTASYSDDGISWTQQGIGQINMSTPMYIGLALTSHDAALTCEAVFSNVTITGTAGQQWSHQDIGIVSNAAEPMYVAVANRTGAPGVVYHDNPDATTIDTWTEWNIDLKDFADQGINLADVNSIAIGFGDRNNPVAGGAGKMYFDDIRLYRPRCVPDKVTLSAADLNGDCIVDMADVEIMVGDWLAGDPALSADLNADGTVDFKDYAALAEEWLDEQLWPEW